MKVNRFRFPLFCAVLACLSQGPAALAQDIGADSGDAFKPDQSQLPVPPPADAVVLLDGQVDKFVSMAGTRHNWPNEQSAMVSTRGESVPGKVRSNHVLSTYHFRDADIHVEFQLPEDSKGNSGIYIHGHYELQIYNSYTAKNLTQGEMGAIYGFAPPLVNAARPPGQWQVYDARYRAPRRDHTGKILQPGSLTVWLNGQLVQDHTSFTEPRSQYHPFRHGRTEYLARVEASWCADQTGPLFLQDHDAPVRFRNVWIRPLDELAHEFKPKPQVLLIALDDMNDWVGCLGGYAGPVHTPNIDRLSESRHVV